MSSRTKAIIGSAVTVLLIAAVFFVGWSLSSSKKPALPPTIQLSPQQMSQQAYTQGMQALSSDDTKTAAALFQKALTLDSGNAAAKKALDELSKSSTGSSTSSASTTTKPSTTVTTPKPKPPAGDPFATKVADILALVPKSFANYSLGPPDSADGAGSTDVSVAGSASSQAAKATQIVWEVHDRGTAAAAKQYLDNVSKELYTHDSASVNIGGYTGYFGTDGTRFATVTVVRGRYVFSVILTTSQGVAPSELKGLATTAAEAFPKTP